MAWIWIGVWVATRALIVADVGFWDHAHRLHLQDVGNYQVWSNHLTDAGSFPSGEAWQYPPGAGLVMLLPRVGFGSYADSFVALMLIADIAGLVLLAVLGRRSGNFTGVWVWLLGMPLLGSLPVLRFDLVPTVLVIGALVAIHRRPAWFGALAGLGAAIKAWPLVLLFGEWDRRRLGRAALVAFAAIAVVFLGSALAFGDPFTFVRGQGDRGLQEEAVATAPWQVWQIVSGNPPPRAVASGSWQIDSGSAEALAGVLEWLSLAVLAAAGAWWWARARAIREGRTDLASAAVSRDFVFTVVLLVVVTSRVLSTQYMIWLLGLAAVVLSAGTPRLARPAWLIVAATILTTSVFGSPENTLIRNLILVGATADACAAMVGRVRRGPAPEALSPAEPSPG
jgi:hypothetical protein